MLEFLLRSSQQGLPGITDPTQVLCPVPGKRVVSIEGFNFSLNLGPNGGVTVVHDIINPSVLNEVYLLDLTYSLSIDSTSVNKILNFVNYRLSFPPDPPGAQINMFIDFLPDAISSDIQTKQFFNVLCSELHVQVNLPVPPLSFVQFNAIGYKLTLQDL